MVEEVSLRCRIGLVLALALVAGAALAGCSQDEEPTAQPGLGGGWPGLMEMGDVAGEDPVALD